MKKALCVLTLLGIVAAARAEVDIRIWLTTQDPSTAGVHFVTGYGPFTPWSTGTNDSGSYDIHTNNAPIPPLFATNGDVNLAKFSLSNMTVEQPTGLPQGTPVYIWAAFCGPGYGPEFDPPPAPGIGWADAGTKINGMNLTLVSTGNLVVNPVWYQERTGTSLRWEVTSDMSGPTVTLVGVNAVGFQAASVDTDRLQNNLVDQFGTNTAAAILLGAITTSGGGDLYVGLDYNGIKVASATGDIPAMYFPGTSDTGMLANVLPAGSTPRTGTTPQASWIPEPASLLLIGLGALILRRR